MASRTVGPDRIETHRNAGSEDLTDHASVDCLQSQAFVNGNVGVVDPDRVHQFEGELLIPVQEHQAGSSL